MATIGDISVPSDSYLDLYTEAGLDVGTAMQLVNKGNVYIYVQESSTQPASSSTDGRPITPLSKPNAILNIAAGSDSIWVRAAGDKESTINVEEV